MKIQLGSSGAVTVHNLACILHSSGTGNFLASFFVLYVKKRKSQLSSLVSFHALYSFGQRAKKREKQQLSCSRWVPLFLQTLLCRFCGFAFCCERICCWPYLRRSTCWLLRQQSILVRFLGFARGHYQAVIPGPGLFGSR